MLMPPDKQVIKLLEYLYHELRSDQNLLRFFDHPDRIIATTLARPFWVDDKIRSVDMHGLPYLAVWRDSGSRVKRVNNKTTECELNIAWLTRVARGGHNFDRAAWGLAWSNLIWFRAAEAIERVDDDDDLGIDYLYLHRYSAIHEPKNSVYGFLGTADMHHVDPPYTIEEYEDLREIGMEIRLYDQDTWAEHTPEFGVDGEIDV